MSDKHTPSEPLIHPRRLASRTIRPRFGELLQNCRVLLMNRLHGQLAALFGQVDDTFFECAASAENNQVQGLFFEAMRDVRRLRPQIERRFHQRVAMGFAVFDAPASPPTSRTDPDRLELVEEQDYEEHLLVSHMVNNVQGRCAQALFALDQRLALVNGGQRLAEDANPFGPRAIAQAFRLALQPTRLSLRIKTILFMLFERQVMQRLDDFYDDLNRQLVETGVLPNLRYDSPHARGRKQLAGLPPVQEISPDQAQALVAELTDLLHRLRDTSQRSPWDNLAGEHCDTRTLLDALDQLQQEAAAEFAHRSRQPLEAASLKAHLQQRLGQRSGASQPLDRQPLDRQQADMIDLIGMLFDYMLDDEGLSDACKATLSHLHTPYLKLALQDDRLLTDRQHPARRLLNALARAGERYGEAGDEGELLDALRGVVQCVVQSRALDDALFIRLDRDFETFVDTLRQRVELRERRAIEAIEGRERLRAARRRAREAMACATNGHALPALIQTFLTTHWADVLVFIELRHGVRSPRWNGALETAHRLAWSAMPLDEESLARFQAARTTLLEDLGRGLKLLGTQQDDHIRRQLQEIAACQQAVQSRRPELAERLRTTPPDNPLGTLAEDETDQPEDNQPPAARQWRDTAHRLEPGARLTFEAHGRARTLKLSWRSASRQAFLFVDGSGQRVAIRSAGQLARELENGSVRLLAEAARALPLTDRALDAIHAALQRLAGRAGDQER